MAAPELHMNFVRDSSLLVYPPDPQAGASGPMPVIVFLHGKGERGRGGADLPAVARWGLPKHRGEGRKLVDGPFPFLLAAPQCPPERTWCDGDVQAGLDRLVDALILRGGGDPLRVFLTGFSMGAIGAFCLALRRPDCT
jgi:poly(3-hydroxybutyrate) depolymerase